MTLTNLENMKLGKKDFVQVPGMPYYHNYKTGTITVPDSYYWGHSMQWPMFLNDSLGDCTCAGIAHGFELWSHAGNRPEVSITNDQVLKLYEEVGGYVPGDSSTDQGAMISDILAYNKANDVFGVASLKAYQQVDITKHADIIEATYLFGGLDIGVLLPVAAQQMGNHWVAPPGALTGDWEPGSWGGHCVWLNSYSPQGVTVISWGEIIYVDWGYLTAYMDEAWACVAPEFFSGNYEPNNFDMDQLEADLALVG